MLPPQLPPFNPTRFKTAIKVAISKLRFKQEKESAIAKQQRRQLADLLTQGKESTAKIRIENIIRNDIYVELLEFLELYCELLLARSAIILDVSRHTCDASIEEAVQSVIYAAPHSELKELSQIRDVLITKYGAEFGKRAVDNADGHVPPKIVSRCVVDPPLEDLVELYLCEVARAYEAPYSGLTIEEPEVVADQEPAEDNADVPKETTEQPVDEFDALKARFAALKGGPPKRT